MAEVNPFAQQPAAAAPTALKASGRSASRYAQSSSSSSQPPPSASAVAQAHEQIGTAPPVAAAGASRSSRESRRALVVETPFGGGGDGGGGGGGGDASSVAASPPAAAAAPSVVARGGVCYGAARACGACCAAVGKSRCGTLGCLVFTGVFALTLFAFSCALLKAAPFAGACGGNACSGSASPPIGCIALAAAGRSCENVCADAAFDAIAPFRFTASLGGGGGSADGLKGVPVWCGFPQANVNWRVPLSIFTALAAFAAAACVATRRTLMLPLLALLLGCAGALFLYVMGIDGAAADKGLKACSAGLPTVAVLSWIPNVRPTLACDSAIFNAVVVLDFAIAPVLVAAAIVLFRHRAVMLLPGYGAPAPRAAAQAVGPNEIDPKSIVFGAPAGSGR